MCGIAGIISNGFFNIDSGLESMLSLLHHRGPDGNGKVVHKKWGFGHTRLSVIDLSDSGAQPFTTNDGRFSITYNGECYNYVELRKELELMGHRFKTSTDTEVVLLAYVEYGESFIHKLNGVYSFAIYDDDKRKIYAYRDRMGVKPLYYFQRNDLIIFSSEVKPILAVTQSFNVNENKLYDYFQYRYVPGEETLFKDINTLRPGHFFTVDVEKLAFSKSEYWSLQEIERKDHGTLFDVQEKFNDLFSESCRIQARSDVPIGVFLSGGIDSSSLAHELKKHEKDVYAHILDMNCDVSESEDAREIANSLGLVSEVYGLKDDDFTHYHKAIYHLEEPLGDSIITPTYLLAKNASRRNKVIFSGEGADEIFNSYIHQQVLIKENKFSPKLLKGLSPLLRMFPRNLFEKVFNYPATLGKSGVDKFLRHLSSYDGSYRSYASLSQVFFDEFSTYGLDISDGHSDIKDYFNQSKEGLLDTVSKLDLTYWLPDYTLLRLDKLTMANGLEGRVPFLDHRLVELCLSIPYSFNTSLRQNKLLLRSYLKKNSSLHEHVIKRPKKAFFLPLEKSFNNKKYKEWVNDHLSETALGQNSYLNTAEVLKLRDKPDKELLDQKRLMNILVFQLWLDIFKGRWDSH